MMKKSLFFLLVPTLLMLGSCREIIDEILDDDDVKEHGIKFQNYSEEPSLLKKLPGYEDLEVYTLISSSDKLPGSPDYTFGGSADGSGLLKTAGGYMYLVNNEDNYAVSRIFLNKQPNLLRVNMS